MKSQNNRDCSEIGKGLLAGSVVAAISWGVTYLMMTNSFFCAMFSQGSDVTDCLADSAAHSIGWYIGGIALPVLPFVAIGLLVAGLVCLAMGKNK